MALSLWISVRAPVVGVEHLFDRMTGMTHPAEVVDRAAELLADRLSQAEVSRRTGVSRAVIRDWVSAGPEAVAERRRTLPSLHPPGGCPWVPRMADVGPQYAYLLGLYLGDGVISSAPRDVFKLRLYLGKRYPGIIGEAYRTMRTVLPNRVGRARRQGCVELYSHSKHWPCVLPQHGAGRKHDRPITLQEWQEALVLEKNPRFLLRGLIHSDGSRFLNWSKGRPYPRYMFANKSADIRSIFGRACDVLGIEHRPANAKNISVARRASVELMDSFVGPKR